MNKKDAVETVEAVLLRTKVVELASFLELVSTMLALSHPNTRPKQELSVQHKPIADMALFEQV
jgi:hypothetical protein